MRVLEDLQYGSHPEQKLDIYLPEGQCELFIVWFHGGGLNAGCRKDIRFHEDLIAKGIGVASVEYRMYPDVSFPVFVEDAAESVRWIQENLNRYTDCDRLYISGQSAGAWLTLMLAFDEHYLRNAGVDYAGIAGFISDSAQITSHFSILRERGIDYRLERIDDAAPIYFLTEKSKVPSLLIIAYENDMPCRPEQNKLFYKSIRRVCPDLPVELKMLPGGHCSGSAIRNEKGTFAFNDAVLDYLKM